MELKILHLFPDAMNLYGEYANVAVLERALRQMGCAVQVDTLSLYEQRDISGYQLYYMGAGTESRQKLALEQLRAFGKTLRQAELLLFTGNAFPLLGASITDAAGRRWEGLHLFSFETVESNRRILGDCLATCREMEKPVVGFMNKCSTTTGVEQPWFELQMGFGNARANGPEGLCAANCLATHLSGPLLVKNPALLRLVLARLTGETSLQLDEAMWKAYETTANALRERLETSSR